MHVVMLSRCMVAHGLPISSPPIHCLTVTSKLFTHVWHIINTLQQSDDMIWIQKLFNGMVWWFNTSNNNCWCQIGHPKGWWHHLQHRISPICAAANLEKCWEEPWCSTHNNSPEDDCCLHVRLKQQIHGCHMVSGKRILQNKECERHSLIPSCYSLLSRPLNSRKLQVNYLNME